MGTRSSDSKADTESMSSEAPPKGRKRQSASIDAPAKTKKPRKSKKSEAPPPEEDPRPRLTTPDLEFDYDRSQLRDSRPTPGRINRPRLSERELTHEFKERFYIPELQRPKGVSKNSDEWYKKMALADPTKTFHDLHVCHEKGRDGSPTYDEGGFQLDWEKVDRWMKPQAYNKKRMVRGMNRAVDEAQREENSMFGIFFVDGKLPDGEDDNGVWLKNYVKDHVSKDLGVPWHQISSKSLKEWEQKGFEKVNANDWWKKPTDEEKKRISKMMVGASLRKDL